MYVYQNTRFNIRKATSVPIIVLVQIRHIVIGYDYAVVNLVVGVCDYCCVDF